MTTTFTTTDVPLYNSLDQQIAGINDLFIADDGNLSISTSINAVLQTCASIARTILGECVLQTNIGLPNFQLIWNGAPNISQWQAALRSAILSVDGVNQILSITTTRAKNVLQYTAVIETFYGTGTLSG